MLNLTRNSFADYRGYNNFLLSRNIATVKNLKCKNARTRLSLIRPHQRGMTYLNRRSFIFAGGSILKTIAKVMYCFSKCLLIYKYQASKMNSTNNQRKLNLKFWISNSSIGPELFYYYVSAFLHFRSFTVAILGLKHFKHQ